MKLRLLIIIFFYIGCNNYQKYPDSIVQNRLQAKFDTAKLEAYKLISGQTCSCQGKIESESIKDAVKSFFLLTLDIGLVDLQISNDTTIIILDFLAPNKDGELVTTTTIQRNYSECFDIVGIVFNEKSNIPLCALIDGEAVIDYKDSDLANKRESNFMNCLKKSPHINKWLLYYLKDNNTIIR